MSASTTAERPVSTGLLALLWAGGGLLLALPTLFDSLEWLVLVSPVPWLAAVRLAPQRALPFGWLGGSVWVFAGLSWMHEANSPAVLIVACLCGGTSGAGWALLAGPVSHANRLPLLLAAPFSIYSLETLVHHLTPLDVSWLFHGYAAWRATPLMQAAEVGGISLVSALLFLFAAGVLRTGELILEGGRLSGLRRVRSWAPLGIATAILALSCLAGSWRVAGLELHDGPRVALVQGNVSHAESRSLSPRELVERYGRLTDGAATQAVDLVLWPESSTGAALEREPELRALIASHAARVAAPIIACGLGELENTERFTNAAFLIDSGGAIRHRQDKRVLVPAAETLLFLDHFPSLREKVARLLRERLGFNPELVPGRQSIPFRLGSTTLGIMTCYDEAMPFVASELVDRGAEAILAPSNLAWFGGRAQVQHLAMSSVRAIENRVPIARAGNTGISCFIDPAGRVGTKLPSFDRGLLVGDLSLSGASRVPQRVRLVLPFAVTALMLLLALRALVPAIRSGRDSGAIDR